MKTLLIKPIQSSRLGIGLALFHVMGLNCILVHNMLKHNLSLTIHSDKGLKLEMSNFESFYGA